jgi:hypothetical protein
MSGMGQLVIVVLRRWSLCKPESVCAYISRLLSFSCLCLPPAHISSRLHLSSGFVQLGQQAPTATWRHIAVSSQVGYTCLTHLLSGHSAAVELLLLDSA